MRHAQREFTGESRVVLKALLFLIACFAFAEIPALAEDGLSKRPIISVSQPNFSFGSVPEGTKVRHSFVIRNAGSAPLEIQRIIPSCGCTSSRASASLLAPGDRGTIDIEFDSAGFSGQKVKLIRVLTNDTENSPTTLSLRGTVENVLTIEPPRVSFDTVVHGQPSGVTRELRVRLRKETSYTLGPVRTLSKYLQVEEVSADSHEKVIRVTLSPTAPVGEFRDRLVVSLQGSRPRNVHIPLSANIQGQVSMSPSSLSFGLIEGELPIERLVKIENLGHTPLVLGPVKIDNTAVTGNLTEVQPGKRYVLSVRIDPKLLKGLDQVRALVSIGASPQPLLLNVYGTFPPQL